MIIKFNLFYKMVMISNTLLNPVSEVMNFDTNFSMQRRIGLRINLLIKRRFARKIFVVIISVVAVLGPMRVSQRMSQNSHHFLFQNQNNAQYERHAHYNISVPGFNESLPKMRTKLNTRAMAKRLVRSTNVSESLTITLTLNAAQTLTCNRTEWVYKPVQESSHLCSECPDNLLGYVLENGTLEKLTTSSDVTFNYPDVQAGGSWEPLNCIAQHRVAVIIPFRDRHAHLTVLLAHLHPIMQRQQLKYQIFVVEQNGHFAFNKARIMNIGFSHAMNTSKWDCAIFHDVDMIPQNDLNMYACPKQPRHLSPAVDVFRYKNMYDWLVGGVLAISTKQFRKINGYSNMYWVWGGEDDDIASRMHHQNLTVSRPPNSIGQYKMLAHEKRPRYPERITLLHDSINRYQSDGQNSLNSLKWEITAVTNYSLYQHIMVDIGPPPENSSSFLDDSITV